MIGPIYICNLMSVHIFHYTNIGSTESAPKDHLSTWISIIAVSVGVIVVVVLCVLVLLIAITTAVVAKRRRGELCQ